MRAVTKLVSEFTDKQLDLTGFARDDGFLFTKNEFGVAAQGVAKKVKPSDVLSTLKAIDHQNLTRLSGSGPIAIGCIPFKTTQPHEFLIPRVVVGRTTNNEEWITVIDGAEPHFETEPKELIKQTNYFVTPGVSVEHYLEAVRLTRDAVRNGDFAKAVIARDIEITCDSAIDIKAVLLRLRNTYKSSYRFLFDGFLGASPELLVSVDGAEVKSYPLAGTARQTGDKQLDTQLAEQLIASTKNQLEHRIVIDMVHDTLLPWCSYLDWQPEPSIVEIGNVQHLGTEISGRLSEPRPSVLELAYALTPTPALGGHPREESLSHIKKVEGLDRGRYGGAVGYVSANGDGCFAVSIRCAEIAESRLHARLFAGGGIVGDSEPLSELAETDAKFQAMLEAITQDH
jgi:menaquinone-specific isochorismate synthase